MGQQQQGSEHRKKQMRILRVTLCQCNPYQTRRRCLRCWRNWRDISTGQPALTPSFCSCGENLSTVGIVGGLLRDCSQLMKEHGALTCWQVVTLTQTCHVQAVEGPSRADSTCQACPLARLGRVRLCKTGGYHLVVAAAAAAAEGSAEHPWPAALC